MLKILTRAVRRLRDDRNLPDAARRAASLDRRGLAAPDPGAEACVRASLDWLAAAQDRSRSSDGGAARDFSLVDGWAPSYPETSGYIVPTLLACARELHLPELRDRARRMTDWLISIQFPDGGFQGGVIGATPRVPVTFNTGQILMGLAAAVTEFGDAYREPTARAARWLVTSQDADGCWRQHATPFAEPGEKVYETHVAWGLLEAARALPGSGFERAALKNVRWALTHQHANGWFDSCDLDDPAQPLTHTIGYALRGVIEAHRFAPQPELLAAAIRTADGVLGAQAHDGRIPGRLDRNWRGTVRWACLTGIVQLAACWFLLYEETRNERYLDAARRANRYVRRTIVISGPEEIRGGVKGSFPVDGAYGRLEYLNWAAKFAIDANLMELALDRDA